MADLNKVKTYVKDRLEKELSPRLTYHCIGHTLNEVVPGADRLAGMEKVSKDDHLLVITAAYFHDLGFIRQRVDHEQVSIELAEQVLPSFGYSDSQIAVIRGIIQATHVPQHPNTKLEKIMVDADMDDLGSEQFWKRSKDLREELEHYGSKFTDVEWYTDQLNLMKTHYYFTDSEKAFRDASKQEHIREVERILERAHQAIEG